MLGNVSTDGRYIRSEARTSLTFIHFHICDCLPLVHSNEPFLVTHTSATKIDDKFTGIATQDFQYRIQLGLAELALRKEE
jgi:hypothetical protein